VDSPTGLLAEIAIPAVVNETAQFVVLLEDIQDPGNLGALLRTAAAAGVEQAYLSTACADAWSPKCLRGGQGAHFRLAIQERADLPAVARRFPVHAAILGAPQSLFDLDLRGAVGFAFGNEGAGLSEALCACSSPFSIPMSDRVESLNVAAAAAVCLFERVRQRRA
jgi:TrmH family RNA methyltransferase